MLEQLPSLVGAAIVLAAFALLKLKKISEDSYTFDVLTLLGCVVLLVAAIIDRRAGFIILNVVWACMSFHFIVKRWRGK